MVQFFTLGVYGSTEEEFFKKLQDNVVDLFCDIRQRRGVRGKKYAYVNSKKLQEKLAALGIDYIHIKALAPTKEIRGYQKEDDKAKNVLKREREVLGEKFIAKYNECILEHYDFNIFISYIHEKGYKNIVFFCVEKELHACHRSLVANVLKDKYNFMVKEL